MKSLRDEIRLAVEEEDGFNFIPKRKLKSPLSLNTSTTICGISIHFYKNIKKIKK